MFNWCHIIYVPILQDYLQDIVQSFGYQACIKYNKNSKNILLSEITYIVK